MSASLLVKNTCKISQIVTQRFLGISATRFSDDVIIDPPENLELAYLNYEKRRNDPLDTKKARLLYQSRKRGMLENGLLLSTFAAKFLPVMNEEQIDEYDKIINLPSNDWDIFYWALGSKPTPPEFENSVMKMLKDHVKNVEAEARLAQPPL